ncbi:MAG TPA: ATPase, partial [Campylobacterales bacterium]|nr:ATPase [Campylobacterales bacterium]
DHILQQLTMELVKNSFVEDLIESIGSYWDKNIEIDILAKTKSGKIVAGLCKYSKAKAGKNELAKLKEDCKKAELDIDTYVIFSKNKFSNELKKEKSEDLKLFALRNIRSLLEGLNPKDLLVHTNKKY